jgi:hypothetical protein
MFTQNIIEIIFQALEKLLVSNMGFDEDDETSDMSCYNDHEA